MTNQIVVGPDLAIQRSEVESLARRASAAGCGWARADLELYFNEYSQTQGADTSLLTSVLAFWQDRFRAACADPSQRRPAFISLLQAQEIIRTATNRIGILASRDPGRFAAFRERYENAADDRERAICILSAEASANMTPSGLVLNPNPTPPTREAGQLIQRLRASGLTLAATDDGRVSVSGGSLSGAQRERLDALRAEVVQLLREPPTEIV